MGKYRVKTIAHLCKNNHLAKHNEVVDESQLTTNAKDLVDAGFIEEVTSEEIEVVDESQIKSEFDLDEMTKPDLIQFAKDNDFEVDEKAKKDVILDQIEKQAKALKEE